MNAVATSRSISRYSTTALILHWLLAILLVGMIVVGWYMMSIEDEPGSGWLFSLHKSVGILVLALVAWRAIWRLRHPPAPLPVSVPAWLRISANVTDDFGNVTGCGGRCWVARI